MMKLSEKDWRAFKVLKTDTLERYCESILEDAAALCADTERTAHERYLALWRLIDERNRAMGKAFDGHSRSRALFQLRVMHDMGLINETVFSRNVANLSEPVFFQPHQRAQQFGLVDATCFDKPID